MTMMKKENGEAVEAAAEEKEPSYGFHSYKLDKTFKTLGELKSAEKEHDEAHAAEIAKSEERKSKAKGVEDAIRKKDEGLRDGQSRKAEAYKDYVSEVEEARKKYLGVCEKVDEGNKALIDDADAKLREFCKEYGSFHSTIKYGDGSTRTVSYQTSEGYVEPLSEMFDRLLFWPF